MKEKNMDSGLVVVVFIITSLIITVFSFLLFVDYEWCHVLFKNNTVSIHKNFYIGKVYKFFLIINVSLSNKDEFML